ncbi:MAG: hypothetical protein JKY95_12980 [Planctomycetaceae bacterium]|nr:hypothetical protein [Planctomycetaceae bacterium]
MTHRRGGESGALQRRHSFNGTGIPGLFSSGFFQSIAGQIIAVPSRLPVTTLSRSTEKSTDVTSC